MSPLHTPLFLAPILLASACYTQSFWKTKSDYNHKINSHIRCYNIKKRCNTVLNINMFELSSLT